MGQYSKNLAKRLAKREALTEPPRLFDAIAEAMFPQVVEPHPGRYPTHKGSKGTVFGGVCNRTACDRTGATWFNRGTKGYYCREDAHGINWNPRDTPLCIEVDHDLTHEEMAEQERAMYDDMRERREKRA